MIALDTSAIVAIALAETEEAAFSDLIGGTEALVGTPTLVEAHLVLSSRIDGAAEFLAEFVSSSKVRPVAFTSEMALAATSAFERYGKGQGHPAQLNFGDCLAYAVAKTRNVPLLYKGTDFALTDIRTALK